MLCWHNSVFPVTERHHLVIVTNMGRSTPDCCTASEVAWESAWLSSSVEGISEERLNCCVAASDLHDLPKAIAVRVFYCLFALPSTISKTLSFPELTLYDRKEKVPPNR